MDKVIVPRIELFESILFYEDLIDLFCHFATFYASILFNFSV